MNLPTMTGGRIASHSPQSTQDGVVYNHDSTPQFPAHRGFFVNQDAVTLNMANTKRRLEMVVQQVFRRKMRDLPFATGRAFNLIPDLDLRVPTIVSELVEHSGSAEIVTVNTTEFPTTVVSIEEEKKPAVLIATVLNQEISELNPSDLAVANGQLSNKRQEEEIAATTNIMTRSHLLGAFGDAKYGMEGMLNNPRVPLVPDAFDVYASTDPQAVLDWMVSWFLAIRNASEMVEKPNIYKVPLALHHKLTSTYFDGTDHNIYDRLMKSLAPYGLQMIEPCNELKSEDLEAAGVETPGTNRDRMVIYSMNGEPTAPGLSPRYQCFFRNQSQIRSVVRQRDLMERTILFTKIGSVINNYPGSAYYVSFPTD